MLTEGEPERNESDDKWGTYQVRATDHPGPTKPGS